MHCADYEQPAVEPCGGYIPGIADVWTPEQAGACAVIAVADAERRGRLVAQLSSIGWTTAEASGGAEALELLESRNWTAVLLDNWFPDLNVEELVSFIQASYGETVVFVRDSATGRLLLPQQAPRASRAGELFDLLCGRQQAVPTPALAPPAPRGCYEEVLPLPQMVGKSPAMLRVYRLARLVSPRTTTVLVTGESGTGKELVASAIHQLSPRAARPFVTINCAAIPESLFESELFGHVRGAFSGAVQSRIGRIQAADGGTLFLDEIGEMPLSMQPKLLRVLQSGEIQRLGSNESLRVDVRVVAATNVRLAERVAAGGFREDLYYRLAAFPIELEPLRERSEDVLPLALHFLSILCREAGVAPKRISARACRFLEQHHWPGNIRELKQTIERAFILSEDSPEIEMEHVWPPFASSSLRKF